MKVPLKIVYSVTGVPNGNTRVCTTVKGTELVVLSSASKHTVFCSPCLSTLPDVLSAHSQTGFQSLENKLFKQIGGQITVQFASTCQKLQKSIDDLSLNIDKLITRNNNIQVEINNTSKSINVPVQSRSYLSAASPSNLAWAGQSGGKKKECYCI